MAKILYKPVGMVLGALAGVIASQIFDKVWAMLSDGEPASPEQPDAGWGEVALSAAVSGAIYAVVSALIRRGGAVGFERYTGEWPGDDPDEA